MGSRGGHSHFGSGNRNIGDQWTDTVKKQIKDFGTKLGISVSLGALISGGIRPDLTMSALKDVEAFYNMFSKAKGIVTGLAVTDYPNAYAAMSASGILKLGAYGKWDLQKLTESYKYSVQTKFHPANTDYHSIIWHELGHALETYISYKEHGSRDFGPIALKTLVAATAKMDNISDLNAVTFKDIYKHAKTISKYAVDPSTDYGPDGWKVYETIAEAIGDYAQNKQHANKFSVAIAEEMLNYLDQY